MGDHFVYLVDRLLTESTLEAAIESRNPLKKLTSSDTDDTVVNFSNMESEALISPRKLVECRICQDDDVDSNMETPCSCCGSLKYAHRKCVQKWCNEKGDTVCEICHQQFKPGYTAPPPLFRLGGLPVNIRGHWQIARRDLHNPRIIAMVSTESNFINPQYDEYADSTSRSLLCCCSVPVAVAVAVAVIFMVLLIMRHTLPVIVSGAENYSFSVIALLLLQTSGIIIPVYIILRAITNLLRRQLQRAPTTSLPSSDEEAGPTTLQHQPVSHIIRIQ